MYLPKEYKFNFDSEVFVTEGEVAVIPIRRDPTGNVSDYAEVKFSIGNRTAKWDDWGSNDPRDQDFIFNPEWYGGPRNQFSQRVEPGAMNTTIEIRTIWDKLPEGTEYFDINWTGFLGEGPNDSFSLTSLAETTRVWIEDLDVVTPEPVTPEPVTPQPVVTPEPVATPQPVEAVDPITGGMVINITGDNNVVIVGDNNDNTLITGMNGRDRLTGTNEADVFTIQGDGKDKIIGFDTTEDTLALDADLMGGIDSSEIAAVDSRKELKQTDSELVYFEPKGKLYLDSTPEQKGFGDNGGLIAKFVGSPEITSDLVEIV